MWSWVDLKALSTHRLFRNPVFRGKCRHYPAMCLVFRAISAYSDKGTERLTLSFVVDGALESVSLLVVIRSADIGSNAPHPQPLAWNCTCSLAMNFSRCDTFDAPKPKYTAYFRYLATCAIGLPFWYWLQGDPTGLRCALVTDCMTTQTGYTCPLHGEIRSRKMLFHVKLAVTLFFKFLCIPHICAVFLISHYNFTK